MSGVSLLRRIALALALVCAAYVMISVPAHALKPIAVTGEHDRIEITTLGELYGDRGDSLMVETAAGADGISGRMSVKAATSGTNPNWMVFALTNPTDKPIERWLTADRYTLSGSGVVWPDLDARRIESVTPSIGFIPQRIKSDRADVFALTVEPGQTITYVAELSSERFARIYLWKPLEYEVKYRDRQLFNGIMLGVSVLAALFLTVIFAANHKLIFPAAALFAWCVLAYLCVDFGFFHKLFNMKPEDNAVYRAAAEASMAAGLVIFLHVFLRLGLSHGLIRMLSVVWILGQLALVAVAAIDPRLAATFARFAFVAIGVIGALATLYLALRGQDRAIHLVTPWILFLVWIFLAGVTLTGRLSGDIFNSALIGGLVLILLLIGFTVTQFAFRSLEPLAGLAPSDSQLRALAVDGAGSTVWEWSSRRDEIKTGPQVEQLLGLNPGELSVKTDEFLGHVHPADRERVRLSLWSVQERAGGKIRSDFRMRHADNSYRWLELEAAAVETSDRKTVRCVGLMRDVTETKMAHERLLHDAVHCNLTGLPNRELLLDRLEGAVRRARNGESLRPAIFFIDIDKFKSLNAKLGIVVGDSLLLTVARRLQRHLGLNDTLARISGDQFAILFLDQQDPRELASLAERVRRSLRAPIRISSQEVVLTGALGIAIWDGEQTDEQNLLKEAEIAMYRAKRNGSDRVEIFQPDMRGAPNEREQMETLLRKAIEKNQLKVLYQPIVYLPTEQLAGFEALVRIEHPKLGLISPSSFIPIAEESDLIEKLGSYVLSTAIEDAVRWQKELPRAEDQLFVSVNVSSRQLLTGDLVQDVRHNLGRATLAKNSLHLEITESLAMENPEHAVEVLGHLKAAGATLAIDDFGTGYSALAYLNRLPCDTIKIDRMMVRAAGAGDESGAMIVRAVVALAHELGKKVVAEGIEEPDDVVFLRSIGCEFGQGYFYGEPMTDKHVIDLLRLIRKSERKLQTRGFYKAKQRRARKKQKQDDLAAVAAGAVTGAEPSAPPRPASLPNSTVRQRAGRGGGVPGEALPAASVTPSGPPALNVGVASAAPQGGVGVPPPNGGHEPQQPIAQGMSPRRPPPVPGTPDVSPGASTPNGSGGVAARPPPPPPVPNAAPPPRAANGSGQPAQPGVQGIAAPRQQRPPVAPQSPAAADGNGVRPPPPAAPRAPAPPVQRLMQPPPIAPDYSTLPPGIAASLARLAGGAAPLATAPNLPTEAPAAERPPAGPQPANEPAKS